jgi:uncharacterized membrane protein YjjP (DUF1212 family)
LDEHLGAIALISASARLLFANGQTTDAMIAAVNRLADRLGVRAMVLPRWGELTVRIDASPGSLYEIVDVQPAGVDMNKVVAASGVIDEFCGGRIDADAARRALTRRAHRYDREWHDGDPDHPGNDFRAGRSEHAHRSVFGETMPSPTSEMLNPRSLECLDR